MTKDATQSNGFGRALRDLAGALSHRQVEEICTSYLGLREQVDGMSLAELLGQVEREAGDQAMGLIVSAFSHRRCYMCKDGTVPCKTCDGTGSVDRFSCPQCDGLGVEPCSFCLGSSWTDRDAVPVEIRQAVLKHHVARVEKNLARLARLSPEALTSAAKLPPGKRTEVVTWLFRLQGRLVDLARSVKDNGSEKAARYGIMAAKIEKLLEALRAQKTGPEQPQQA